MADAIEFVIEVEAGIIVPKTDDSLVVEYIIPCSDVVSMTEEIVFETEEGKAAFEVNITDDAPVFETEIRVTLTDDASLVEDGVGVDVAITMSNLSNIELGVADDASIIDTKVGTSTVLNLTVEA